jgi:hypothetical protein
MACTKLLSFAEIVQGRDASVRVTDDGMLDVVDLVMVVTGKNCNCSNEVLRNIKSSLFDNACFVMCNQRRYVTLEHAITLIMVLPGKKARLTRKHFKGIIVRYLDGDLSMCYEIEANQAMGRVKSYAKFASKVMKKMDDDEEEERAHSMPQTCYIYATKSPAFPGLIKIGKTIHVAKRVTQLNTACAPAPHVIVAVAPTFDDTRDETAAHAFFSNARRKGEFFELEDAQVLSYFAMHITAQYNVELAQNITRLQGRCI